MKNNYVLCCGSHTGSCVGIYRQAHGVHPAAWELLDISPTFPTAKAMLRTIDPQAEWCPDLRREYRDESRRWALFYKNYEGEPIVDGRQLGSRYRIEDLMQMEPVAA